MVKMCISDYFDAKGLHCDKTTLIFNQKLCYFLYLNTIIIVIYITVKLRMSLTHFLLALCVLQSICCASTIFYTAWGCFEGLQHLFPSLSFFFFIFSFGSLFLFSPRVFRIKRQLSNELKHVLNSID